MKKIVVLVSGGGTNLQALIDAQGKGELTGGSITCVVSSNPNAYALKRAEQNGIETEVIRRRDFDTQEQYDEALTALLQGKDADLIVLAGFMTILGKKVISAFENRIINIHPALLPKYGGKGMYGHHVHEAVIANKEKESGITIHIVDDQYDRGLTLFQAKCSLTDADTPDTLADKIHLLEQEYFPVVIEKTVLK